MLFNPHQLGVHKVLKHLPLVRGWVDAPYQRAVRKAVNIADLRSIARKRAHKMVFDYLDGGADDEITMRRNKDAYSEYEMHYKVLRGIKPPLDLSTTLFGKKVRLPFFGCPTAGNRMFHESGEVAAAAAAQRHGCLYAMSSLSSSGMDEVAAVHDSEVLPKVFQLYVWKDRGLVKDVLVEARNAGFTGLALTVDVSWMGNRERDPRNGFTVPPTYSAQQTWEALKSPVWTLDFLSNEPYSYACFDKDVPAESMFSFISQQLTPDFSWSDAEWLLGEWNHGPTAIKGVVRPEDAATARSVGFGCVWVSNHGGRQLETAPSTIDVLPSIREAVGNETTVLVDGGIQRGTDIAKALALGADGVGIGRAYLWGLAAGGHEGVHRSFEILTAELDRAMGLLGVGTVQELKEEGPALIRRRHPSPRDYPDRAAAERGYGGGVV